MSVMKPDGGDGYGGANLFAPNHAAFGNSGE
jgi:hypothetical protein